MKKILTILFVCSFVLGFGQNKWASSVYLDLMSNNSGIYTYYDGQGKVKETTLEKGSYELIYNIDYRILNKLSVSALMSYNCYLINSNATSLKIGSGIKFIYTKDKFHYLTLQYGYSVPFNKRVLKEGHQIKVGQYFDITQILGMRLLLGLSYNYDFLYLNEDILFGSPIENNKEPSLKTNSIGISLGVQF